MTSYSFIIPARRMLVSIFVALTASSVSLAGLTGLWNLNEGSGTTAANQVTGGTAGTINNGTSGGLGTGGSAWITNDPFRGTVFGGNGNDSSGAYIDAGSTPQAQMNGSFSWSFWAALNGSGGNDVVLGNRYGGPGWVKFTPSNYEWQPTGSGSTGNVNIDNIPQDGSWHYHTIVKDGNDFQYYIDGQPGATATFTRPVGGDMPFFIGGDANGERPSARYSAVATFDEALTQSQILAIRNGDFSEFGIAGTPVVNIPVATGQQNNTGFTVSSSDLLEGLTPTSVGNTPGDEGTSTNPLVLTNGVFGPGDLSDLNEVFTIQDGSTLTYELDLSGAPAGYDITQIDTYTGWRDDGRNDQDYVVQVAMADDPLTFIPLADVSYNPSGTNDGFVSLTSPIGDWMASGVSSVRFFFDSQENGWIGYREIDVFGTATVVPNVPEPSTFLLSALGLIGLAIYGRRRKR